jgi:hypothetical protein
MSVALEYRGIIKLLTFDQLVTDKIMDLQPSGQFVIAAKDE